MKELGENVTRQLDLVAKYYKVDHEKRIITITFHYEKATDILDLDLSQDHAPVIKNEVLVKLSGLVDAFPNQYKTRVELQINDYEGYDADSLITSFTDSLELFHYTYNNKKSKKFLQAAILILVGIMVLFAMFVTGKYNWIENEVLQSLFGEANTVVGWVFIWQAVTVLFLEGKTYGDVNHELINRISSISLLDKKGVAMTKVKNEEYMKKWFSESYRVKGSRLILLIVGTALLTMGPINFVMTIMEFVQTGQYNATTITAFVIILLGALLFTMGGVGALSLFYGHGPLIKAVPITAIILLVLSPFLLILTILSFVAEIYYYGLLFLLMFVASIAFFVAWVINLKARRKFAATKQVA